MGNRCRLAVMSLLLGACGKEASFADAGPDAPTAPDGATTPDADTTPDARVRGPVTVDVRSMNQDGLPEVEAPVVFVDIDGTVTRTATDADGRASAEVAPGASVTVVWPRGAGARLVTILAIVPGDELFVGTRASLGEDRTGRTTVTLAPQAGLAANVAYTTCGSVQSQEPQSTTVETGWFAFCEQSDDDFLVMAYDEGGAVDSFVYLGNQPNASGHPTAVTMPTAWQAPVDYIASLRNVPDTITSADVRLRVRSGTSSLLSFRSFVDTPPGTTDVTFTDVPLAGDSFDVNASFARTDPDGVLRAQRIRLQHAPAATGTVDLGAALPFVTSATLDLAERRVSWTEMGTGTPDVQVTTVFYDRTKGQGYEWRVIAPGGTGALTLPALPAEVGEVAPLPTDSTFDGDVLLVATGSHDTRAMRSTLDIDYFDWREGTGAPPDDRVVVSGVFRGK
jgi:hypothetical protein